VPGDADSLTALTRASKAVWGYSATFMQRVDAELVVSASDLTNGALEAWLAYDGDELAGYYAFRGPAEALRLDSLFVAPARLRRGVGRALWQHALARARERGARRVRIVSDPNAAPFYRAAGAHEIGEQPSSADERRSLPVFEVHLDRPIPDPA
jgi:GNAT superfamily N-acetyltransferase